MTIREYEQSDASGWLTCRLLSFFDTSYYDDVKTEPTHFDGPAIRLVAEEGGTIAGLIDVELDDTAATIDSIAVHPDHQRSGLATALLDEAIARLPEGVATIDAWTREDEAANAWYQTRDFTEQYRYLHVYKQWDDADDGWASPPGLGAPVTAFAHAPIDLADDLRARFTRVHVCCQYLRRLG